jgi:hypothetical protein
VPGRPFAKGRSGNPQGGRAVAGQMLTIPAAVTRDGCKCSHSMVNAGLDDIAAFTKIKCIDNNTLIYLDSIAITIFIASDRLLSQAR